MSSKIKIFVRSLVRNRILTIGNLRKRNVVVVGNPSMSFLQSNGRSDTIYFLMSEGQRGLETVLLMGGYHYNAIGLYHFIFGNFI